MNFLLRPLAERYREWMLGWENELCFRATDRVARPFEYGLEWSRNWPVTQDFPPNGCGPAAYLAQVNERAIASSDAFFGYETPHDFRLERAHRPGAGRGARLSEDWVEFTSPVQTPHEENNLVRARWFPARQSKKAVVLLPHWNAKLPQHNALCAGIQRLGISTLRLSLPYHDARMPAGLSRADFAVSSNICRTIDATRQAVVDSRCCFDWLEQQGYTELGIVGTSLGSCYAFLASAHDPRIRVNVFNHCSTYFADVVWEGLSTRHVRESLNGAVDLETLRKLWLCISPPCYWERFTCRDTASKFIYTRYDTTFPPHLSQQVIQGARQHLKRYEATELLCGHYTMGEFPFKYIAGYQICAFLKRNL